MNREVLQRKAARCRRLADEVLDERTSSALMALAAEYEAQAGGTETRLAPAWQDARDGSGPCEA